MTRKKLAELRQRMLRHTEVEGTAVVILTAKELQELLDLAETVHPKRRRTSR